MTMDDRKPSGPYVIRRKIMSPRLGDSVADRARVVSHLDDLLAERHVVLVQAAAGSGKTTAVAMATRRLERPVAWLSFDGTELAPGRLLAYLEEAVTIPLTSAPRMVAGALEDGLLPAEVAGVLAESWSGTGLVLVCDNVEKVARDAGSWATLSSLVSYLPADVSLVLISRIRLPVDATALLDRRVVEVGQDVLDFDRDEAEQALRRRGDVPGDLDVLLGLTHGWVAGVLFEGERAERPDAGRSVEFESYLSAEVLGPASAPLRGFLARTSILPEVSTSSALALGEEEAPRMLAALEEIHLPAWWSADRSRFVMYPQVREFLEVELVRTEPAESVRRVRRAHADLLAREGRLEEAVDALLELGETELAWQRAAQALPSLVARMDFTSAARWLDELDVVSRTPTAEVGAVVLRVSFALEQCGRGNALLEAHGFDWLPGPGAPFAEEALLLAAWCRWHAGELAEARALADRLPPGRARETAENLIALSDGSAPPFPDFSSTRSETVDTLLMRIGYYRGRLRELERRSTTGDGTPALGVPWVIAGLRAKGRLDEAMELYDVLRGSWQPPWLHAFDAVDLMIDLGRRDEAWAALTRGSRLIAETGSKMYRIIGHLNEAKLSLRLHRDAEAARRALADAEDDGALEHAFSRELSQLWRGFSYLLEDRDVEARAELAACVDSMQSGDRRLELATAAIYLAEACWRIGDEEASDAAAEMALAEATTGGSQHLLLTALHDVPAVAVRAADASPTRLSRWHELTAMLSDQGSLRVTARAPRLLLEEFGDPVLTVDGEPVLIRLSKSIELLSYLIDARREVSRRELLGQLFESSNDAAGRSYLRQALYRLREVLPEELMPRQEGEILSMKNPDLVCGTTQVVLDSLVQADRQDDEVRLRRMVEVLTHAARGPYLATLNSQWVEARRVEIGERVTSGRIDAARLAFRLSRYREGRQLVETVLRESPHREQAWQLAISLAHASGSDDAVLALYQRYVSAMRGLGVAPSAEVRRLVTQLRR